MYVSILNSLLKNKKKEFPIGVNKHKGLMSPLQVIAEVEERNERKKSVPTICLKL